MNDFSQDERIAMEKEMLGVYITAHPLEEFSDMISRMVTVTSRQLAQVLDEESEGVMAEGGSADPAAGGRSGVTDGMNATMAGIVTGKKNLITKNNKMMAFVDLEDLFGNVEVVVFPNVFEKFSDLVEEDRILAISGRINFKEGEVPKLLADQIVDLREMKAAGGGMDPKAGRPSYGSGQPLQKPAEQMQPAGLVKIRLPEGPPVMIKDVLRQISRVMKQHPGRYQAIVYLPPDGEHPKGSSFRTAPDLWTDAGEMFRMRIVRIVGEENYKD